MSKIYTTTEYNIENLLSLIDVWSIWLPDLQRPFVWNTTQVRQLFDSLYKGFPVWFFLFWKTKWEWENHNIGNKNINKVPDKVIVDWQQRLTSLYAVIKWETVLNDDYKEVLIKLAFNPKTEKIEVSTPAFEKSNEWIPDISVIWKSSVYDITTDYLQINEFENEEEKREIPKRIQKLYDIKNIWFSALEILENVEIEEVSEIFVRINSEWKKLDQLDFILTLLSVYWDEWRKKIEQFAYNKNKENKFENLLDIIPWDIIKVLVSYTFFKWRLKDMYNLLKWRDVESRTFKEELREERLEKLKINLDLVLNQTNWNNFFKIFIWLWFKNSKTINSSNNVLFSYILYLIWKERFKLEYHELEKYIWKYYVYLVLSAKYSSSVETTLEKELKNIEELGTKQDFINFIEKSINDDLWEDFWNTKIINDLNSSSTRNNIYLIYLASKMKNNHKILFSDVNLSDLLDDNFKDIKKKFLDIHHIFPKNYLNKEFWLDKTSDTNQIANYVYLNYNDNIKISDKSPKQYYEEFLLIYWKEKVINWFIENDIPLNFYELNYNDFLEQRRLLMRNKIKEYFYSL